MILILLFRICIRYNGNGHNIGHGSSHKQGGRVNLTYDYESNTDWQDLCDDWNAAKEAGLAVPEDNQYDYTERKIVWDEGQQITAISSNYSIPLFFILFI